MGKPAGATPIQGKPPAPGGLGCGPREIQYPASGVWRSRPCGGLVLVRRPDCRRYVCDRCGRAVYLCSWCDRGQRYCSIPCRRAARRESLRAAGRRYQQTRRGRLLHARRQQAYRKRQREKVTHHGCRTPSESATVAPCAREPDRSRRSRRSAPRERWTLECVGCGVACEAVVRHDFLRCRRPWRAGGGPSRDLRASGSRDPSPG